MTRPGPQNTSTSGVDVAVVGGGWMGGRHAAAVSARGDRVVAVVDQQLDKAAALATRFAARPAADIDELDPEEIEAAIVATPTADHRSTTRALLDRGIPVLVEKPHRMPDEPRWRTRSGDPACWVAMTTRFLEGMIAVRRAIDEGALGEVRWWSDRIWYHLQPGALSPWYFDPAVSGGGVLATNGVHALDRIRWMLGDAAVEGASLAKVFEDHAVEDAAQLWGAIDEGRFEISLIWASGPMPPSELVVIGTEGTAVVRPGVGWKINGVEGERAGTESGDDETPVLRQWAAFVDALSSTSHGAPTPDGLEPVLEDIEIIYERHVERS